MECVVILDEKEVSFEVEGNFSNGRGGVLFDKSYLNSKKIDLVNNGWDIKEILNKREFDKLYTSIKKSLNEIIENKFGSINEVELEDYHEIIDTMDLHNHVTSITKNFTNDNFDFSLDIITKRVEEALGLKLDSYNPDLGKSHVQLRISRPNSLDINPPHRDSYLTYYENVINLWIPIAGCDDKTILPVATGSHKYEEEELLKTESKGAKINGNSYMVPCILSYKNEPLKMNRPALNYGEAIVFTPYLIHGAAMNMSSKTRMSLELRLTILKDI